MYTQLIAPNPLLNSTLRQARAFANFLTFYNIPNFGIYANPTFWGAVQGSEVAEKDLIKEPYNVGPDDPLFLQLAVGGTAPFQLEDDHIGPTGHMENVHEFIRDVKSHGVIALESYVTFFTGDRMKYVAGLQNIPGVRAAEEAFVSSILGKS